MRNFRTFEHEQQAWLDSQLERIPYSLRSTAEWTHREMCLSDGLTAANIWLRETVNAIKTPTIIKGLNIDARTDDIRTHAENLADDCRSLLRISPAAALDLAERRTGKPIAGDTKESRLKRITDSRFWKQQARKTLRLHRELWHLRIAPEKLNYCSIDGKREYESMVRGHEAWAKDRELVSNTGESFPMPTPSETSERRYAQLVAMTKGLETLAIERSMVAHIITVTLDTQYHAARVENYRKQNERRTRNPKYKNLTPQDGHKWLTKQWGLLRNKLARLYKKKGIETFWVLGAQPHRDTTEHWHVVMWCDPLDVGTMKGIFDHYFRTNDNPAQIDFDAAQAAHGAAAYATRMLAYITRHVSSDEDKEEATNASAWASTHSIRRYRTSDTKATLWKLSRKKDINVPDEMKYSAVSGDYAGFLKAAKLYDAKISYVTKTGTYGDTYKSPKGIEFTDEQGCARKSESSKIWAIEKMEKAKINDVDTVILKSQEPRQSAPEKPSIWSLGYKKVSNAPPFVPWAISDDFVFGI